jgi:phosphatidylserine/phosphatidylglycerophosphate/cardiolipin synthase-like enzyme
MRTIAPVAVVIVLLLGSQQLARPPVTDEGIKVHFSPDGGCTDAIVETLGKAKTSIDVQAYSFTSTAIATAIAEAHDRGLKVRVILDKKATGDQYSGGTYLTNHGVPTFTDGEHTLQLHEASGEFQRREPPHHHWQAEAGGGLCRELQQTPQAQQAVRKAGLIHRHC